MRFIRFMVGLITIARVNHFNRLGVVVPALWCCGECALGAEPSSLHAELMIFSGTPNPAFEISEPAAIHDVVTTLDSLPRHPTLTAESSAFPSQLGYNGFRVTATGMEWVSFHVYGTAIEVHSTTGGPEARSFRIDKHTALEQLLFRAARIQGAIREGLLTVPRDTGYIVDRNLTITLGAHVGGVLPTTTHAPITVPSGTRIRFVAAQADENSTEVRWVKDSRELPATGREIEIAHCSAADSGRYWAVIGSGSGQSIASAQVEAFVTTLAGQRLLNVSVLGYISTDQPRITCGFTIESAAGSLRTLVLVRAIGPGLEAFGIDAPLVSPELELLDNSGLVIPSANIPFALPTVEIASERAGAFPLPPDSVDVAQLYFLTSGAFTAHVTSGKAAMGKVLLEVFEVPLD